MVAGSEAKRSRRALVVIACAGCGWLQGDAGFRTMPLACLCRYLLKVRSIDEGYMTHTRTGVPLSVGWLVKHAAGAAGLDIRPQLASSTRHSGASQPNGAASRGDLATSCNVIVFHCASSDGDVAQLPSERSWCRSTSPESGADGAVETRSQSGNTT